jgi:P27 family predicted phage terminase small subunit
VKGTKPGSIVAGDLARVPSPPRWLSATAKGEWRRVLPGLIERRILTNGDMSMVESFCVAAARVREIEAQIQRSGGDIDPRLFRMQDKAMTTARQIAAELGLTPVSRSRPSMREEADDDDSADLGL